jgi:hypothetical protein
LIGSVKDATASTDYALNGHRCSVGHGCRGVSAHAERQSKQVIGALPMSETVECREDLADLPGPTVKELRLLVNLLKARQGFWCNQITDWRRPLAMQV